MTDRFATLRTLLDVEPSRDGFEAILHHFRQWPAMAEKAVGLQYAMEYLQHWPDEFRVLTALDANSPFWPMTMTLELKEKVRSHRLRKHLMKAEHLSHITGIRLLSSGARESQLATIFDSPHLRNIRHLELHEGSLTAKGLQALLPTEKKHEFESLHLEDCNMRWDALVTLLAFPAFETLASLTLKNCTFLSVLGTRLDDSSILPHLERLTLLTCEYHEALVPEPFLTQLSLPGLRYLRWEPRLYSSPRQIPARASENDSQETGPDLYTHWFGASNSPGLRELDLRDCVYFDDYALRTMLRYQPFPELEVLNLSQTGISSGGLNALAQSDPLKKLSSLDISLLSHCKPALPTLFASQNLRSLERLTCDASDLTVQDLLPHVDNLANLSLTHLSLNENLLEDGFATIVEKSGWHHSLHRLSLVQNRMENKGAIDIAALDWPEIRTLDLSKNRINTKGAEALLSSTTCAPQTCINLEENPFEGKLLFRYPPNIRRKLSSSIDLKRSEKLKDFRGEKDWKELVAYLDQWPPSPYIIEAQQQANHLCMHHGRDTRIAKQWTPERSSWPVVRLFSIDGSEWSNEKQWSYWRKIHSLEHLTQLAMTGFHFSEELLSALAAAFAPEQLETLTLQHCKLSRETMVSLGRISHVWKGLRLVQCEIAEDGLQGFFEATGMVELDELFVVDCGLTSQHLKPLLNSIACETLKRLNLSHNRAISDKEWASFLVLLELELLEHINLRNTAFGDSAADVLSQRSPFLREQTYHNFGFLDLRDTKLTENGLEVIARSEFAANLDLFQCSSPHLSPEQQERGWVLQRSRHRAMRIHADKPREWLDNDGFMQTYRYVSTKEYEFQARRFHDRYFAAILQSLPQPDLFQA